MGTNGLTGGFSETIKSEAKEQNSRFLCMLLRALGAILLGNLSWGKGVKSSKTLSKKADIPIQGVMRGGEGTRFFDATSSFNKFWNTKI